MSFSKNDQIASSAMTDKDLALLIQKILRQEYSNRSAAVKRIGQKTGIELRAIRNWYEGRKPPKSIHLLLLSHHYPEVLQQVICSIGHASLWALYKQYMASVSMRPNEAEDSSLEKIYSARSCTINVTLNAQQAGKLNQRQLWFLGLLQQRHKIKVADIVAVWGISSRTAKYDVAGLADLELVRFVGARKTGHYEAVMLPLPISVG